jgi:regulator of cell morphogenesis and NO signaling
MNTHNHFAPEMTVAEITAHNYAASVAVFERYGIDVCCGGTQTLSEACQNASVPITTVLRELESIQSVINGGFTNHLGLWSLTMLCDYILQNHHGYAKTTLPSLKKRLERVMKRHLKRHLFLESLAHLLETISDDLLRHLYNEEEMLFPYIKRLERHAQTKEPLERPFFHSLQELIERYEHEHQHIASAFKQLHYVANGFIPPDDACTTFRALYTELKSFYEDSVQHMYLENNVLFPRAIALEQGILYQPHSTSTNVSF